MTSVAERHFRVGCTVCGVHGGFGLIFGVLRSMGVLGRGVPWLGGDSEDFRGFWVGAGSVAIGSAAEAGDEAP